MRNPGLPCIVALLHSIGRELGAVHLLDLRQQILGEQINAVSRCKVHNVALPVWRAVTVLRNQPRVGGTWRRRDRPPMPVKFAVYATLYVGNWIARRLIPANRRTRRITRTQALSGKGVFRIRKVVPDGFQTGDDIRPLSALDGSLSAIHQVKPGLVLPRYCFLSFDLIQRLF